MICHWDSDPTVFGVPGNASWPVTAPFARMLGASVLLPMVGMSGNTNTVLVLGGQDFNGAAVRSTNLINGILSSPTWEAGPTMHRDRHCLNAVLMPNAEILAVGGATKGISDSVSSWHSPSRDSEIYNSSTGWRLAAAQNSVRIYHSTAALLPSGRVVSAGSDEYVTSSDYEIYTPEYLTPPAGTSRPEYFGASAGNELRSWSFDATYFIEHAAMDPKEWIAKVVLMRPCSTTHHSDFDQRYLELAMVSPPAIPQEGAQGVWVQTPPPPVTSFAANQISALPGYYMMFLVSNLGFVSNSRWVRLQ